MAIVNEAELQDVLFARAATLTTTPATTLAWPNVNASNVVPRIEIVHLPNTTFEYDIAGSVDLQGFLQLTVVTAEGTGVLGASDIAQQVLAHFHQQTLYTTNYRIMLNQRGSVSQSIPDNGELRTPVSIPYKANN
jgi:hypothetical protein